MRTMPIQRAGDTPPFVELPLRYIVSDSTLPPPSPAIMALNPTLITIPSFQRGIEWGKDEVESLLSSPAVLYGTVILGSFPSHPQVLIDGLQRFATATALLDQLYLPVLQPNPVQQGAAPYFQRLRARVAYFHPIVDYNVEALSNHKRRAILISFLRLYAAVGDLVQKELVPNRVQAFASRVERMLLDRQVAIDPYFNFASLSQMTGTFVTLNTAGLELSPIDLVRSRIVDQASNVGWNARAIARMEDRFTDVFETAGPKSYLRALAKAVDEVIREPSSVGCLFPNWAALQPADVDQFIDFIDASMTAGQMGGSAYFRELLQCSPAIFALTVLYYLRDSLVSGATPSFLPGGTRNVEQELHLLLRSAYRRLVDGTIFRVGDMIFGVIGSSALPTAAQVADTINSQNPAGPLTGSVDPAWLDQRLREVEGNAARRVFNACLLPGRAAGAAPFLPLDFGRRANQMTLDHLIPSSQIAQNAPGEQLADCILNLAPLITQNNRVANATPCSSKLGQNGIYSRQIAMLAAPHPYLDWLVNTHFGAHAANPAELDDPGRLLGTTQGSIGQERATALANILGPLL